MKLLDRGKIEHERLRTEGIISRYLESVAVVDDYKTIQKSVNTITEMLDDAVRRGVEVDPVIIGKADIERERLVAERNLRHATTTAPIAIATNEDVSHLEDLIMKATDKKVANEYVQEGEVLAGTMQSNINAHHILALFLDYPPRDYPPPPEIDKRTGKPVPVKAAPPPPKRRRREPKFIIPEWAGEIN